MKKLATTKPAFAPANSVMISPAFKKENAEWRQILARRLKTVEELAAYLEIKRSKLSGYFEDEQSRKRLATGGGFPVNVPKPFADLMKKGDPDDPLLRQVMPNSQELSLNPDYGLDPLAEQNANPLPGLLHKYESRALLLASRACPINCRYCFRRYFSYAENEVSRGEMDEIIDYLLENSQINELILSGGDPLMLAEHQLSAITDRLAGVPNLRRIRVHTRFPVTIPQRINQALLAWVQRLSLPLIVVLHINHPHEVSDLLKHAVAALLQSGVRVLSQSVLLRGVNNSTETLVALSEALFEAEIQPYYLHLLDKVQGAQHFNVPEIEAIELMRGVQKKLPGFLVPRLVKEQAGMHSKTIIF